MNSNYDFVGSSFEDFLREEGIFEEVTEHAIKRVQEYQKEASLIKSRKD